MTDRDSRPLRRRLRTEAVAVDAFSSVFLANYRMLHLGVGRALGWAAVAALLGVALMQSLRLLAPTQAEGAPVDLLGVTTSAIRAGTPGGDRTQDCGEGERPNLFGKALAAVAIPFVAIFVAARIAILYLVPTLVVTTAAMVTTSPGWAEAAAAWTGSVGISLANEFALIRPIARRNDVSLG